MLFLQQIYGNMEYFNELKATKIFSSASEFECQAMMFCFKTKFKTFDKNENIIKQGDRMEDIILILKGGGNVENVDSLGNISIVMQLKKGDVYGIESAYAGDEYYKDSVIATEKSLVLFMNKHRLINPCENRCKRHDIVVKNLMQMVAESDLKLLDKLTHISKKTTREKLLSYLSSISEREKSNYFEIPFNITELANYLSVDRSAMSNELSKLKKEGIIDYDKRQFHIYNNKLDY